MFCLLSYDYFLASSDRFYHLTLLIMLMSVTASRTYIHDITHTHTHTKKKYIKIQNSLKSATDTPKILTHLSTHGCEM
jgi:hypothetical protein